MLSVNIVWKALCYIAHQNCLRRILTMLLYFKRNEIYIRCLRAFKVLTLAHDMHKSYFYLLREKKRVLSMTIKAGGASQM